MIRLSLKQTAMETFVNDRRNFTKKMFRNNRNNHYLNLCDFL